ncbi:MAG TPA: S41 family peptidase, partial [Allosphingosinicella sp.]
LFGGAGREPDPAAYERQAQRRNYGIRELRVLPGNVRYMAYDGFDWTGETSARALETAMRFLSGGDAVIIDLRRNGGGSPAAVQYITSHFMAPDQPLMTFHMNGSETPDRTATLAEVPAGRMIGKPLYVLTSNATASAAEEFAGHVAGYRLGQLVGENTGGAGFRNELVPIQGRFILSVSVGRAVLASTGRDWEAVGHAPNIVTPVPAALDAAHAAALRQLAESSSGADRDRMLALADTMAARGERRSPTLPLTAYAGAFGERAILVDGDRLYYQRGQRPRELLIPLGANRFALENNPLLQVDFAADGSRATAFTITPIGDAPQGTYQRTQ